MMQRYFPQLFLMGLFLGMVFFLNCCYVFISDDCFYGSMCVEGRWQHLGSIAQAWFATLADPHRPVVHFIVRVFTGCFDKWLFDICNTAMAGMLLLLACRLAFGRWMFSLQSLALAVVLFFFSLCKGESLTWCAGSVNYLWTAVATMAFCLIREKIESEGAKVRLLTVIFFAVAALFCGGMNETFSPPICFALGICTLIDIRRLGWRKVLVYGAYVIPMLAMAWYEKTHRVGAMMPDMSIMVLTMTAVKIAVTVKCVWVMFGCFLFSREKRDFIRRNLYELLVVGASVGLVLAVGFHGERTLYCSNLFAMIVVLREWRPNRVVCGAGIVAVGVVSALLVPRALSIRSSTAGFIRQYLAAPDSVTCHEFVDCGPLNWYFYQEIYNWQPMGAHPIFVACYYGKPGYPIALSRRLYDEVYLSDRLCVETNRLATASGLLVYSTPDMNTIVVPVVRNSALSGDYAHVSVRYAFPAGALNRMRRDLNRLGKPVVCYPEHPQLLKTDHGDYWLVAKEPGADRYVRDVVFMEN